MDSFTNWMSGLRSRHYPNAPIREAIVDIQIEPSPSITPQSFEVDAPQGYGARSDVMLGQLQARIDAGSLKATTTQDRLGVRFVSEDSKHVAQLRVNGFTFSRLAPYQTWEQLRQESKPLWELYRAIVGDQRVIRVGLRYLNQLDLPADLRDFRDYIRTYPEVSSDLPQGLSRFFVQLQIPLTDIDATLIINEAIVPPPSGQNVVSIVLDIDVFMVGPKWADDKKMWQVLEELRVRKNLVFEACITNKTRELIS